MLMNNLILIYVGNFRPFKKETMNRDELISEYLLGNTTILLFTFTDYCPEPEMKYIMGWAYITFVLIAVMYKIIQIIA